MLFTMSLGDDNENDDFSGLMMAIVMIFHLPLLPLPVCHPGFASYSRTCQSETNTP